MAAINWVNPYKSANFQEQRDNLLKKAENSLLFKGTKPYHKQLSEGCRICGSGEWSCLFITNKCNAGCFYCPTPQLNDELPSTQGLDFEKPEEYAEYIKHFNFKGASISGGEPLLFFERTLDYLKQVRKHCPEDVYTWLYTNGILTHAEKLHQLAATGLNEIRFDIGATKLSLENVKKAKGIIPNITIEIPAIPEEKDELIKLLPQMIKAGVTNLNLHQLRLTPHNVRHLVKRDYTIINAEKPIVLESELAALEILNYARQNSLDIGINYCSFFFKNRFQKAGYRKQLAKVLAPSGAVITENGYIREFTGDSISYKTIKLYTENHDFLNLKELQLSGKTYYCSEETVFKAEDLSKNDSETINLLLEIEPNEIPSEDLLFKIWQLEYIERGLREY